MNRDFLSTGYHAPAGEGYDLWDASSLDLSLPFHYVGEKGAKGEFFQLSGFPYPFGKGVGGGVWRGAYPLSKPLA